MYYYHPSKLKINNQDYKITGKLGSGKKTKVFKAIHVATNEPVAIKTQRLQSNKPVDGPRIYLEQFMMELWSLSTLVDSKRVIKLYNYEINLDENNIGRGMAVLELGRSIPEMSRTTSKYVREPTRAILWSDMAESIAAAHRRGIVHADVKPQNFVLANDGLKLIDFAYSLPVGRGDCDQQVISYYRGTIDYISPEVLIPKPFGYYSKKCDVWALGCILLQYTFATDKDNFIINSMSRLRVPTLRDYTLEDLINKCLQPSPHRRPCIEEVLHHKYSQLLIRPYSMTSNTL